MEKEMLTETQLRKLATCLSKFYPYKSDEIFTVMLQTQSIDTTIDIVHNCTEQAQKLDEGVYCFLKYRDTMHERKK